MALFEFKLPDLGEGAGDEATVSFWYAEVGEPVKEKDGVVEMRTDKATFDVPCPVTGKLVEVRARDDDKVKVGGVLGIIETAGKQPAAVITSQSEIDPIVKLTEYQKRWGSGSR